MRLLLLMLAWFALAGVQAVRADDFQVPGLERDSQAYAASLQQKNPAGLAPQAKRQAQQRLDEATRRGDAAAQVAALESLLGDDATAAQWLSLGRAQLAKTPPDAARAAQAGWMSFGRSESGVGEVPALLLLADAFRRQNRLDYTIRALEAVQERAPDNKDYAQLLTAARQEAGIQVRRVSTEPEAEPPQACISFTTAPARRSDFVAADWVRLSPATPDAAITRQGDQICIAGLRLGATTQIGLRAGLPGEDGLKLNKDALLNVAMANRRPRLGFDSRMFILPRGQAATVKLTSVNLSAVKLQMLRLTERNAATWSHGNTVGEPLESYQFDSLAENGKIVWQGSADLARWQPNKSLTTALPLPDAFKEPGIYLLMATPGDGTPAGQASATQVVIRTDLAPTVWRGADGLTVQVRSLSDAATKPAVRVRLLSHANEILAETQTDANGVAIFAAPLLQGTGPQAPDAIHAFLDDDFVSLQLSTAAFDLSDRGVEGATQPGPLDAFPWTDRGIYRPGETVQLMGLLRDSAGVPQDIPVHVVVKRPNGQTYLDIVPPRGPDASFYQPLALSASAPAGQWTVEVLADPKAPAIGQVHFRVDAFVPDRMAVDVAPQGPISVGKPYPLAVTARFLYGAPAANLTGKAHLTLSADPTAPPALPGYTIGLADEVFAPDAVDIDLPMTDAKGQSILPVLLKTAPDTTRPVKADIDVGVDDPSGRSSHAHATIAVRPRGNLLGIKPAFVGGSIDAGGEAAFDFAAVDAGGARVAVPVKMKLVRERPDWRLVTRGSLARYETVFRDEPIEARDLLLPADGAMHYAKRLDFGRYRIEITEANGLAATSIRFRAGWIASESPDTPDKVDVSTDRRSYSPGDLAKIHVVAPFAGKATLLVLTDRVQSLRTIDVAGGGSDIDVPVDAAWGPGAYATVHVFRGMTANGQDTRPARAIGLAWMGIDPATRTVPVVIMSPEKTLPRARLTIPVKTAPGAWVTLAAVDEGVLRLTSFVSPDPIGHFLGRRSLGIDIRDDWGRLIAPGEGEATTLRQGGDDGGNALPEIPQKVVALFTPPVQAGPDGMAQVTLDLPDFNGQVRLMAVAWQGRLIGAANVDMIVRDPFIAEPLLPRFLAPGDTARLAVLMQNLELPLGETVATVTVEGPLQLTGETRLTATLERNAQVLRTTNLVATGAGRGIIRLAITGPGGFTIRRETAILIRPARAPVSLVASTEQAPRTEAALEPALARMVSGTGSARVTFGGPVRYDVGALLQGLHDYPLACLEQSVSRGLPLALLPDGPLAGADRGAQLQQAVALVLDKQRYDGAFALWSANGEAEPWLSAYATDFLLRARTSGAAVPEGALTEALKTMVSTAQNESGASDPAVARASSAYALYVLAAAGTPRAGANRLLAEQIDTLPTPLAKAQLAAALALSNDRPRAEAAFLSAISGLARKDWDGDRGSALRDQMAVALLLKESGLLPDRLAAMLATLPGADLKPEMLNTQEQAWAASAAAVLGRDGRPARVSLDGQDLPVASVVTAVLTGPARARNLDDRPIWRTVSTSGVTTDPLPAARTQMRVSRKFFTLSGDTLDLDKLKQNTVFILLMEGRADDGQDHRAMLLQGLPAGWEIAGRLSAGKTNGMPWLGELSETDSQPAADDRFAATMSLSKDTPGFRVAVRLRAVTPGDYELPGAQLSDMYRPALFARQATNRVKVLVPE